MAWPPARFVAHVIEAQAPRPIDPQEHPPQQQRYLREFFEAVIRTRAEDARLTRRAGAIELVALYASMPIDDVLANLTALNHALEAEDRARNPPGTYGSHEAWEPLALTQQFAAAAADVATYAELVSTYAGSLSELRASQEVIEAVVAVSCHDSRRAYLLDSERDELVRLAQGGAEMLLDAYTHVNRRIQRLGLDERIRLNPFIAPDEDSGTS